MQPVDLAPFRRQVGQQRQYDVQGIEHDALRPHFPGLGLQRRQHPAEIEVPGLDQVGQRLRVHEKQLLPPQLRELPIEACGIGHDALRGLLESDEDARLLARARAMHQELQREHGLAGARPAHQQRGAAARQAAAGDFIETGDAGRRLGRRFHEWRSDGFHLASRRNRSRSSRPPTRHDSREERQRHAR